MALASYALHDPVERRIHTTHMYYYYPAYSQLNALSFAAIRIQDEFLSLVVRTAR